MVRRPLTEADRERGRALGPALHGGRCRRSAAAVALAAAQRPALAS